MSWNPASTLLIPREPLQIAVQFFIKNVPYKSQIEEILTSPSKSSKSPNCPWDPHSWDGTFLRIHIKCSCWTSSRNHKNSHESARKCSDAQTEAKCLLWATAADWLRDCYPKPHLWTVDFSSTQVKIRFGTQHRPRFQHHSWLLIYVHI